MANVIATLDIFDKIAVVSAFTYSDDTKCLTLRVGQATMYFTPAEARDIARQLVARCDEIEAEEIANGK